MGSDEIVVIEKIHDYLNGTMKTEDRVRFEEELKTVEALRNELAIHQEIIYTIRKNAFAERLRMIQQQMHEQGEYADETPPVAEEPVIPTPIIRPINSNVRMLRIGLAAAASIAAVLLIGFWLIPLFNERTETIAAVPEPTRFTSPIQGLEVPQQVFELNAADGNSFRLESGTLINIPPNAFADSQGKSVSGKVQLTYREFHDGLEMLASGIPMKDLDKVLESAGMFEINGYQDGKPLTLTKPVAVSLASFTNESSYSNFHLASFTSDQHSEGALNPEKLTEISEIILNAHKKAYLDSLRAVYLQQAEASARAAFENQQLQQEDKSVNGFQIQAAKTDVILSWLNTQGMEYIGFYPSAEDPEDEALSWVTASRWQTAKASKAMFIPLYNIPVSAASYTEIVFSPDGKKLLLKSFNKVLLFRANGQQVAREPLELREARFSPDGEYVLGFSEKKELLCYRASNGEFVTKYGELAPTNSRELNPTVNTDDRYITNYVGQVMTYDISLDGKRVVTIHADESAVLWEIDGKMISRRKGLPKSWFVDVMFTNRTGTQMIGKMHDNSIYLLNDQWQQSGRRDKFERPANYDSEGILEKNWAIIHNTKRLRQPDGDVMKGRVKYKEVAQHVFYINRKQRKAAQENNTNDSGINVPGAIPMQRKQPDSWQAADTLYISGQESASLYAIAPQGQAAAMLMGGNKLIIWPQGDPNRPMYRLSLDRAIVEPNGNAQDIQFYTYVQPAAPKQKREQPRLASLDELIQRNRRIAEQRLKQAEENYKHEADHLRIFHVTAFGIYHVSRHFEQTTLAVSHLNLSFESSSDSVQLFQLAGNHQNVVLPLGRFALNSPSEINFDASGGHLIGVLPDNTVLVFAAKDFDLWIRQYKKNINNPPQLVFKKIDKDAVNYNSLKKILAGES
ncbi:hypothetical protein [Rhodoflexus sp.]